jgi:thymidylate synthase
MNNLDKQYQNLLQEIIDDGILKSDRTGTGTKSIFSAQIKHDMKEGFPLLTTKRVYWKGVVTELLWFLRGDTNIKWLVENGNNIWVGDAYKSFTKKFDEVKDNVLPFLSPTVEEFMTKEEFIEVIKTDDKIIKEFAELGPIYGAQWRDWGNIDQIQQAINTLKTNPDSRRIIVSAWNVGELDNMVLPPCHWAFELYSEEVENGKRELSLKWHQRSVDTFLGLPFNVASYGLLLSIIAKEVGMIPGMLIGDLTNVHLYNNHIEQALEQINREPNRYLPELVFKDSFWDICDEEKDINDKINRYEPEWFTIEDYLPHPTIKAPLSN